MQFPRINAAINLTLMYYNKQQIISGVGLLSGEFQPVKHTLNGVELPTWDKLVLNSHQQMEEEINQIINLNYIHVRNIVFENLREVISNAGFKSLNKEFITRIADENNEAELLRIATKHPNGFAVTINKDYLPDYFKVVDFAISNLKRIINKYLTLHDSGNLPVAYPQPDSIKNIAPAIKGNEGKLKINITIEELTVLFRLMKESKIIYSNFKDCHRFIANNFYTDSVDEISIENVKKLWSSKDPDVLNFLIRKLTDMSDIAENK